MPSENLANPQQTDFVDEELPPDFWDEPATYDEMPSQAARPAPPPPLDKTVLDKDAPLFDQLKQLFPGRVVRIDPLETTEDSDAEALEGETSEDADSEDVVQDSLFG